MRVNAAILHTAHLKTLIFIRSSFIQWQLRTDAASKNNGTDCLGKRLVGLIQFHSLFLHLQLICISQSRFHFVHWWKFTILFRDAQYYQFHISYQKKLFYTCQVNSVSLLFEFTLNLNFLIQILLRLLVKVC